MSSKEVNSKWYLVHLPTPIQNQNIRTIQMKALLTFFTALVLTFVSTYSLAQGKWDSIAGSGFGNSYNQVGRMINYNNAIYCGIAASMSGGRLFQSPTGDTSSFKEEMGLDSLFKAKANSGVISFASTTSGGGYLFAGTQANADTPSVYRFDGSQWKLFSPLPLANPYVNYSGITAMCTYSSNGNGDSLFIAISNFNDGLEVYASPVSAPLFTRVLTMPYATTGISQFNKMIVFNGTIYGCTDGYGTVLQSSNGLNWSRITNIDSGFHNPSSSGYSMMEEFNGKLYISLTNYTSGASIYSTVDGVTWLPEVTGGFGHGSNLSGIDDMHAAYGKLWISSVYSLPSVMPNPGSGGARGPQNTGTWIFYSTNGSTYVLSDSTGFNNGCGAAHLTDLNYTIYAGANNNAGAQIWRTCVPPLPSFGVDHPTQCVNTSFTVYSTSSGANHYKWYVNGVLMDSLNATYNYTPSTSGNLMVTLKAYNNTCIDSVSQIFTVNPQPVISMVSGSTACMFDTVSIASSVSGGTTPYTYSWCTGATTSSIRVSPSVQTSYTLTVTDLNSCTNQVTSLVTLNPVPTLMMPFGLVACALDSVHLVPTIDIQTPAPPYNYLWNTGAITDSIGVKVTAASNKFILKVTNGYGCSSKDSSIVTVYTLPVINMVNTGGCPNQVVSIKPSVTGGTPAYQYSWSTGGTKDSISLAVTASVQYFLTVSDNNNCHSKDSVKVTMYTTPVVHLGGAQSTCNTDAITLSAFASSGLAPYTYLWNTGKTTDTLAVVVHATSHYTVTVKDANQCVGQDTATIHVTTAPAISGTVSGALAGPITSGKVYLVHYNALPEKQFITDTVSIVNGSYSISGLHDGNYLIFAKATESLYPNVVKTYSLSADQWDSAAIVLAPCSNVLTANIHMREIGSLTGSGSLAGNVRQGWGFGVSHRPVTTPVVQAPGEPIPGLDVNLEQHPGGIIAHDTTDINGDYHFGNVPPGNYSIYVDIAGLGIVSQYTRTITTTQSYVQLNYLVDSTHIFPDSITIITNIKAIQNIKTALLFSPNPFKDQLNISYSLSRPSDVSIEVYNTLGVKMTVLVNHRQEAGEYTTSLNGSAQNLAPGVYLLKMTVDGDVQTRRIVHMK
jgi:hypothetical protein